MSGKTTDVLRDYMKANRIFDHPEYGFCKFSDVRVDENLVVTVDIIPVTISMTFDIELPATPSA